MDNDTLRRQIAQTEMEIEVSTKRLNVAKQALAGATAVAWVAYFADHDWMKREHVGFQVIPISQEIPAPQFITMLLEEHFVLLPSNPEMIPERKFGKINRTSMEFSDKSQRGRGWYEVAYAVFYTKEEAVRAEQQLREMHAVNWSGHAG